MTSLWLAAGFVSCLDEPLMDDEEIGEGTAMVSFDITSVPQTDAELGKSRAEGEADRKSTRLNSSHSGE